MGEDEIIYEKIIYLKRLISSLKETVYIKMRPITFPVVENFWKLNLKGHV